MNNRNVNGKCIEFGGSMPGSGAYSHEGKRFGYVYYVYYYIVDESSSCWKIALWIIAALLLLFLIVCGITTLSLIPLYITGSNVITKGFLNTLFF